MKREKIQRSHRRYDVRTRRALRVVSEIDDHRLAAAVELTIEHYGIEGRQIEVAMHALLGTERAKILREMNISRNTFKAHVRSLLTQAKSRSLDEFTTRVFRAVLLGKFHGPRELVRASGLQLSITDPRIQAITGAFVITLSDLVRQAALESVTALFGTKNKPRRATRVKKRVRQG